MSDRASTPANTALLDQVHAAAEHATRALHQVADGVGYSPSAWAKARVADLMRCVETGSARACHHMPLSQPRVLFAAAWHHGVITCADCVPILFPQCDAQGLCDQCSTVTASPRIHAVVAGPLIYVYGLCQPCHVTEEAR